MFVLLVVGLMFVVVWEVVGLMFVVVWEVLGFFPFCFVSFGG